MAKECKTSGRLGAPTWALNGTNSTFVSEHASSMASCVCALRARR